MKLSLVVLCFLFSLQVHAQTFEVMYVDKNGLEWSQVLGQYKNCTDASSDCLVPISSESSPAARACEEIGAELPSHSDWMGFLTSFDHKQTEGRVAVYDTEAFFATFGDLPNRARGVYFWTSTAITGQDKPNFFARNLTIIFREPLEGGDWNVQTDDQSARHISFPFVRCVKRPNN